MFRTRRWASMLALLCSFSLVAAACGDDDDAATDGATSEGPAADGGSSDLAGTLVGAGASAQAAGMDAWIVGFQTANPDVTVEYDPVGSGGGRTQFLEGGTLFAGSDSLMDEDEYAASQDRCASDRGAIHLPHYISPIAVAFNLDGIESLNLRPEVIAGIFAEEITSWDDPAIAEDNPDVDLPSTTINPVHRSDESGTTENFTEYLSQVAGDVWTEGAVETWPYGGEGAQGTSGVVAAISAGNGSIGYADASQVTDLGQVAVGVGDEFVEFSPEAAGRIVDVSERRDGNGEFDFQYDLVRDTTESGVYPIVLISYHIVCLDYDDEADADLVRAFMEYVSSADGQDAAAAEAGSAPISDELRSQLADAIAEIGVA